jgi:hypothetical protein
MWLLSNISYPEKNKEAFSRVHWCFLSFFLLIHWSKGVRWSKSSPGSILIFAQFLFLTAYAIELVHGKARKHRVKSCHLISVSSSVHAARNRRRLAAHVSAHRIRSRSPPVHLLSAPNQATEARPARHGRQTLLLSPAPVVQCPSLDGVQNTISRIEIVSGGRGCRMS